MHSAPEITKLATLKRRLNELEDLRERIRSELGDLLPIHIRVAQDARRLADLVQSLSQSLPSSVVIDLADDLARTLGWCVQVHALFALLLATGSDTTVTLSARRAVADYAENGHYQKLIEDMLNEVAVEALAGKEGSTP